MIVDNRPLRGWRLWLFTATLALGTVVVLSNIPGYTITVPYVAGSLGGVTPSFGTWGTTDHMVGLALGLPFARWFAGRFGDYRVYVVAFLLYACTAWLCAASETPLDVSAGPHFARLRGRRDSSSRTIAGA